MDYKSRRTRTDSEHKSPVGMIIFVLISIAMILFIVLTAKGKSCESSIFATIFGNDKELENKKIVDAISQQESAMPSMTPSVTASADSLRLDSQSFFILQMGQYADELTANAQAKTIQAMGAGGFVHNDGKIFRVFAAAYSDQTSLQKVQEQIRTAGFEGTAYIMTSDTLTVNAQGDQTQLASMKRVLDLLFVLPSKLSDLSLEYDKGNLSLQECIDKAEVWEEELSKEYSIISSNNTDNVKYICSYVRDNIELLSTFSSINDNIDVNEASSTIKRLQLETIISFVRFVNEAEVDNE